jgi:hypothetical protein
MDIDPQRSLSLGEFCYAERISKSKYYALKRKQLGPHEISIDGLIRITAQSYAAWRARMAELAKGEAARLEAERRRELAVIAGRLAAQSPNHVSRRARPVQRRGRR